MFKRNVFSMFLALFMLFASVGCGQSSQPASSTTSTITSVSSYSDSSGTSSAVTYEDEKEEKEIIVYITQTGEKYHTANCQYVRGKDNLTTMTLNKAITAGYGDCSKCSVR